MKDDRRFWATTAGPGLSLPSAGFRLDVSEVGTKAIKRSLGSSFILHPSSFRLHPSAFILELSRPFVCLRPESTACQPTSAPRRSLKQCRRVASGWTRRSCASNATVCTRCG